MPDRLALSAERLSEATRRLWGRQASVVLFDGWGSLRDHAEAGGKASIDAAVLPTAAGAFHVVPDRAPTLWVRSGAPLRRVGVCLRHPAGEAVLAQRLGADARPILLPPAALWPNLVAGLIDAAVLLDEGGPAPAGLNAVPLPQEDARILLPALAVVPVGALA